MALWLFTCNDNGGKKQALKIKAGDKTEAINKGFEKARKNAAGNIGYSWTCKLLKA